MDDAHTANLLGALSLVVHDRFGEAMTEATGGSETAAAALSSLDNFLDRPTIDTLRRVLGLTSSGTVRLVDRLEDEGLVERGTGEDRRAAAARPRAPRCCTTRSAPCRPESARRSTACSRSCSSA